MSASRNALLALVAAPLAGAGVTLSLAPFNLWPAGIAGCAVLAWLLCTCSAGQAALRGWGFGLGMFGSGVSWVYVSIHTYGYASPALAGGLTAAFCAGLALLLALFGWTYARFIRPLPGGMLLGFPLLWVLFEWLRSWLLTGFPWLYLGYAHVDTWIAGWAPIGGVFALSFIVAISGACLFLAWRSRQLVSITTYAVILATLWVGGAVLRPIEWVVRASERPLTVAIYQPNVPQEIKWNRRYYPEIIGQLKRASLPLLGNDILVWPEAAVPNYYQNAEGFIDGVAEQARVLDTTLVTGIPYRTADGRAYYNSIIATGSGSGVYHKQRLVPFGEYVPLEQMLRGLIAFFDLPMSDFTSGPNKQLPLQAGAFRVAPFICYEIVYPELVAWGARRADLMITISNDSWFGDSIGPLQHLQMAQMRALENGRYLIRGTNNGVSAIVDHRGQILARSERFVETSLTGEVEPMLGKTPFGTFGCKPVILGCFLGLVLMYVIYVGLWRDTD
ncbi:apolipoprotein N-acyltransferase [Mangrovimicrobium sediminis]|uniref:Apolipoprotein N-acyltransferase n=1 Tax=Mangrovimicrobium sediminis TaxID=2562682 RepID=A0A4Z0M3M9_9GAMM|nr:apolipoprotein N-acyltransferase [Haliea sp. SAOS-164]TGD74293.1 apolipoprotein N-acyltransferase [Haliea sp. SAOS-164]